MERLLTPERAVDAMRFLRRGLSLLDAIVLIKLREGTTMFNGVRVTPELVVALRADTDVADARATITGRPVDVVWASADDAIVLRTPRYDGALPELSLAPREGSLALVWVNPAEEARIAFGRALEDAQHDVPSGPGSMGAPLFDDTWGIVGLHRSRDLQGRGSFVPIVQLVRELEQADCWGEIAAVHRLVRTAARREPQRQEAIAELDIARAVRWTADGDNPPTERERRRAITGKTLEQLRSARGPDAATTPEQRAIDRILAGPPYSMDTIGDETLLPFATAVRWFRDVVPLPDDATLEREIGRRRQASALAAIVGPRFAPRDEELARLRGWLADRERAPLVMRGPGGIGKSALLAHFILDCSKNARFAWIDFDRPDVSADERTIARIVGQQLAWQKNAGPLVVVLDSFETSVQTYGYTRLNPALDALAWRFDDLAVIVGTRAPVPLLKVQGEPAQEWELPGLPLDVVTAWLVDEGIEPSIARRIAPVTNGIPLNMRLARDLLKDKSVAQAGAIAAELPKQLVTGYLYRRILRRLRDDTLKEQAQWAMVPRHLVLELIAPVLRVTPGESQSLFAALRSELTLLEGDTLLTLRPDLRNTLLPLLEAEDLARVREIDTIAADFWSARATDEFAAAEAVYHVLRLGDLSRADTLWREGLAQRLGAYAMEELPPASQAWLEARASRDAADQSSAGLLGRGKLSEARAALRWQPTSVDMLSAGLRTRRFRELAAAPALAPAAAPTDTPADTTALESIVLANSRPSIRVRDGTFAIETPAWSHLAPQRALLERAIAATGRVQSKDGNVLGSATLVGNALLVTTRGVAEHFAVGTGRAVKLIPGRNPMVDMRGEGVATSDVHEITRIVLVHPYWDIAIVEAPTLEGRPPLSLETSEPATATDVVVIGHPSRPDHELDLAARVFEDAFDVKRIMPGKYHGQESEVSFGSTVSAGSDDASTLSPDHGAAVVDPLTGRLRGVRFSWVFLTAGKFVPAWELARDLEIAHAGVSLAGMPAPPAQWTSAWNAIKSERHLLLDAFVARTSGDLERARSLLDLVSAKETALATRLDRTLLQAACEAATNRLRAADLLHQLIAQTPPEGWAGADRDAVIATRLRLAVDGDAENEFLQVLQQEPAAAGLVKKRHFRVLAPPGANLPWGSSPGRGSVTPQAIEAAKRVVDASDRCLELRTWIDTHAGKLADLSYLFDRSILEVRELAAAYVAFPLERVRSVNAFLLEKTDLAPHPTQGWAPLVEPLFMMFRDVLGSLPGGIKDEKDLEKWLDANAKSGRLGAYLTELLRFDSEVAWQAGLLHLSTELPIESVLKRRFTRETAQ